MRRDQFILLLQPYKNGLMPKRRLTESVNRFARLLFGLCEKYPRLRFNVALPGYLLECVDPLVLSSLRDMAKRGSVEWLCMGYTEPFLSFSPLWLTNENIALGAKVFTELTGEAPTGFVPPFSNWEPSHIDMLGGAGFQYAALSSALLAKSEANAPGYWITEYTGSSMAVFPARSYHKHNAPESVVGWINSLYPDDKPDGAPRMLILKYLYSLEADEGDDGGGMARHAVPVRVDDDSQQKNNQGNGRDGDGQHTTQRQWLENISAEIEKHILELQPLRCRDVLGNIPPLGLHYFPPGLVPSHNEPASPYFLNHLHCYDQIGVMQRKLMDVCDSVREIKDSRQAVKLKRLLFFAQDINRFLPSERAGFSLASDRLWTYGKLIEAEREIDGLRDAQGGVIRLTDFLRNGYKSAIMSNHALKLYLDHKNGAQVYELDYRERQFNACAAYNPAVRQRPNIVVPRESRLGFRDLVFTGPFNYEGYANGTARDCANFSGSPFEYTFKNSPGGVRMLLNCAGGFNDGGRDCPLTMDKVFGLEKDGAALSYSYKLGNPSLTDYAFTFAIELPLALPGCRYGNARVVSGRTKAAVTGREPVIIEDTSEWAIEDHETGVRMEFVTQKKVNVWLFSPDAPPPAAQARPDKHNRNKSAKKNQSADRGQPDDNNLPAQHAAHGSNGVTLLMSCPVEIENSSALSLTGRVVFKKIKAEGAADDSL